jgi:cellulose biosynthesis protein BcsQ
MPNTGINVAAERAAGAVGAGPATEQAPICREVQSVIDDMRSDIIVAVRMDEFVDWINSHISVAAEERGEEVAEISREDVVACLRNDPTVKIINVGGVEVVWLWGGGYLDELVNRAAAAARKYRVVLVEPEKYDEWADE